MSDLPLPEWLLRWLSVDPTTLEGGEARVSFARFPEGEPGLLAILAIAAVLAWFAWLYWKEGTIPLWRKAGMATVRALLVVAVALVLFYPVLEVNRARDLRATTVVMLDDSRSMGIADRYRGVPEVRDQAAEFLAVEPTEVAERTRIDLLHEVLRRDDRAFLRRLRESNLLEVFTFSDRLRPVGAPEGGADPSPSPPDESPPPPDDPAAGESAEPGAENAEPPPVPDVEIEPRGSRTDLAGALRAVLDRHSGGRIAGVVVVGDGRLTAGEGISAVAEILRKTGVEVHTVGVGDPTPPRNYRISAVLASERVFTGDPSSIDVRVRQQGYDDETVRVEIVDEFRPRDGGASSTRSLGAKDVSFAEGETEASAAFSVELEGVGVHRVTARIEPREEESFLDDNSLSSDVEVIEEASRVLLISGAPTWEYRFLKNLLRRDRRVSLAAWLMSADPDYPQEGNTSLEKIPADARELFEYDVVMLLDPDPDGFPPGFAELLTRFVGKHRGGLLYVAGEKYSLGFFRSPRVKEITEMVPVVADLGRAEDSVGREPFHEQGWPLVPTRLASTHAATRLSSQVDRNRMRWAEVSEVFWAFPVKKAKPGASVLLEYADPVRTPDGSRQPVLAWQFYEGGRAIYLGSDESWRWRATTEEIYDQFWIQIVRYLTETRLSGGKRRVLQTDSEACDLGDAVKVSALLLDENYKPIESEYQTVTVEGPDGATTELRLTRDAASAGWFGGILVPRQLGDHRLRLSDATETRLRVEPPRVEFQDPRLDEATLRELAQRTGGSYSTPWEAAAIPDRIPDRRQTVIATDEPIPLWDNWFSLSLLAGLLTLEWVLRKLHRLL